MKNTENNNEEELTPQTPFEKTVEPVENIDRVTLENTTPPTCEVIEPHCFLAQVLIPLDDYDVPDWRYSEY